MSKRNLQKIPMKYLITFTNYQIAIENTCVSSPRLRKNTCGKSTISCKKTYFFAVFLAIQFLCELYQIWRFNHLCCCCCSSPTDHNKRWFSGSALVVKLHEHYTPQSQQFQSFILDYFKNTHPPRLFPLAWTLSSLCSIKNNLGSLLHTQKSITVIFTQEKVIV